MTTTKTPIDLFPINVARLTPARRRKLLGRIAYLDCSVNDQGMVQAPWCWSHAMVDVIRPQLLTLATEVGAR